MDIKKSNKMTLTTPPPPRSLFVTHIINKILQNVTYSVQHNKHNTQVHFNIPNSVTLQVLQDKSTCLANWQQIVIYVTVVLSCAFSDLAF